MSGPSLARRDAHHAIHQAAFDEAEQLTRLLRQALLARSYERALQLVGALIEHWQARTLRHAQAEEVGWYREIVAAHPERQADVLALTRDHELLRILFAEIQGILARHGGLAGVLERFEAMLLVNAIHSREEERRLLGGETGQHVPQPLDLPDVTPDAPSIDALLAGSTEGVMPLSVAHPSLYAQLLGRLETAGLHAGDVAIDIVRDADGSRLRARSGPAFASVMEWTLPEVAATPAVGRDLAAREAIAALLDAVTAFCAGAVEDAYRQFMRPAP